ncbi:MAG: hypothetical protein CVU17_02340 [Betaproteobacteria bacterium HGW-Betaproteobacteria-11]|nr:MAG: hypothetical protein CVU17_02340 [Betaproteobacteria bacterium HGW-Betaproteobacteria-11]
MTTYSVRGWVMVTSTRCSTRSGHIVWSLRFVPGNFYGTGVFRGGTALLLRKILETKARDKQLRLFDTFGGIPEVTLVLPTGQAIVFKL